MEKLHRTRVLINPKSGIGISTSSIQHLLQTHWDRPGIDLSFQYSKDKADGISKARRAVGEGFNTILIVGGDGMVNSIGSALIGTSVALGVIPAGSGNGFARHFGIPLNPEKAILALQDATVQTIDVEQPIVSRSL